MELVENKILSGLSKEEMNSLFLDIMKSDVFEEYVSWYLAFLSEDEPFASKKEVDDLFKEIDMG